MEVISPCIVLFLYFVELDDPILELLQWCRSVNNRAIQPRPRHCLLPKFSIHGIQSAGVVYEFFSMQFVKRSSSSPPGAFFVVVRSALTVTEFESLTSWHCYLTTFPTTISSSMAFLVSWLKSWSYKTRGKRQSTIGLSRTATERDFWCCFHGNDCTQKRTSPFLWFKDAQEEAQGSFGWTLARSTQVLHNKGSEKWDDDKIVARDKKRPINLLSQLDNEQKLEIHTSDIPLI